MTQNLPTIFWLLLKPPTAPMLKRGEKHSYYIKV